MLSGRIYFVLLLLFALSANAQYSSKRLKKIPSTGVPVVLDTLSVMPSSISIYEGGRKIEDFSFDMNTNALTVLEGVSADSLVVFFRTFPFSLNAEVKKRGLKEYDSVGFLKEDQAVYKQQEFREELFRTKGLNKNGNITRGVSFGNQQDVFVNSSLNLQMEGKITEDVTLTAVVTDQNVPFQPEGNTQQLQEFDRIYLQLDHRNARLTAGDIVMRNNGSEFLRYYKNAQGGQLDLFYNTSGKDSARTTVGIALSKGKFASQIVNVIEGVQGPYRLTGPSGERFIIVIANSERVFLDGQMLKRGFDYDYIIDYNQGEIVFTNRIVITQYTRVRVDFEYSDRNYARLNTQASHYQTVGKLNFFTSFYQERDNPRNPLAITLTDADKEVLTNAGDNILGALTSGVDSVGFSDALVLYEAIDTIVDAVQVRIFRYSVDPQRAVWRLSFSEVAAGQGNYILKSSTANGRVFEWVPPVNGIPQGRYEPLRLLPTPRQKLMATAGAGFNITENQMVFTEVAVSKHDLNLYSDLDSEDDVGTAIKTGYRVKGQSLGKGYLLSGTVDYEYNQSTFNFIDRLRYIEFDRDWSADPNSEDYMADENILSAAVNIEKDPDNKLNYAISRRKRGFEADGYQQQVELNKNFGRIYLKTNGFLLKNTKRETESNWARASIETFRKGAFVTPGYVYSVDRNAVRLRGNDSVIATAMNFDEQRVYLKSGDSLKVNFLADYSIRHDNLPVNGELKRNTRAETAGLSLGGQLNKNNELKSFFTYRKFSFVDTARPGQDEETLMGRLDWNADLLNRHIRSELTYIAATGRELRREYVFLSVPTGEGTHFWRDLNENGVQDLDEFFLATTPDQRQFVKIFVPTDDYIKAYTSNVNYRLNINTPRSWRQRSWGLRQLGRLSAISAVTIDKKTTDIEFPSRFVPFVDNFTDDDLLSTAQTLRSTLFFNRTNPSYGLDFGVANSRQKNLLTNGFEIRNLMEYRSNGRVNLTQDFNLRGSFIQSTRLASSDFLTSQNYRILSNEFIPELAFQPASTYRLSVIYSYSVKRNEQELSERETAETQKLTIEGRINQVNKRTLNFSAGYINIRYIGQVNTQVAFEMLEAFLPGENFTWGFNLTQRLANGLQMNINYEGRKSPDVPVVHIGRMQVTALF